LQLAELLARGGKPEEALDAYQKALAANPAIPAALVGQSRLYAGPLNSPEKALKTAMAVFRADLHDAALGQGREAAHAPGGPIGAFAGPAFDPQDVAGYLASFGVPRRAG